jgi:hypothetical protein
MILALFALSLVSINLGGFKSVDEKKKMLWKSKAQVTLYILVNGSNFNKIFLILISSIIYA